jgi:hypothetical protein
VHVFRGTIGEARDHLCESRDLILQDISSRQPGPEIWDEYWKELAALTRTFGVALCGY